MISDVLSDAAADLDGYLNDPAFADVYTDDVRQRARQLQRQMADLAAELDALPHRPLPRPSPQSPVANQDPGVQHLVRWLSPFVQRNSDDFARTWSFVASDAASRLTAGPRDEALLAAYDTVSAIRVGAGILDS